MLGVELGDDVDISAEIHPSFARILLGVITSTCRSMQPMRASLVSSGSPLEPYVSALYDVVRSFANLCRPGNVPVDETGNVSAFSPALRENHCAVCPS